MIKQPTKTLGKKNLKKPLERIYKTIQKTQLQTIINHSKLIRKP